MIRIGRRNFLAGVGGALVALPFLESMVSRRAHADEVDRRFFLFFRQWYGVQQRARFGTTSANEPEGFWPDVEIAPGGSVALTKDLLSRQTGGDIRATGELADFADSLLLLRGVRLMDLSVVLHRQNLVQVLSGSRFQNTRPGFAPDDPNNGHPMHETLDNLIARKIDGSSPAVFECVIKSPQTSFRNGADGEPPIENPAFVQPSAAYAQLFTQAESSAEAAALRTYATDAVAAEIKSLRSDPRLSAEDRRRLDQHFEAMREVETKLQCIPPGLDDPTMATVREADTAKTSNPALMRWQESGDFNEYVETVTDAFIRIAALGVACGAFRAGDVVMPGATNFDHTSMFDPASSDFAQGLPGHYHPISHRSFSDALDNDPAIGDAAVRAHHAIDRWHGRQFAKLLGLLRDYDVLDHGVTLWSNEISFGNHWAFDMPYVIAGSAGGKLETGAYHDLQSAPVDPADVEEGNRANAIMAKQMPCSRVLNTIGAALGLQSADGSPLADFGGLQRDRETITGNLDFLLT